MLEKTNQQSKDSPLGKELKKHTRDPEKQYKKLDNAFESNKKEEDKISKYT